MCRVKGQIEKCHGKHRTDHNHHDGGNCDGLADKGNGGCSDQLDGDISSHHSKDDRNGSKVLFHDMEVAG